MKKPLPGTPESHLPDDTATSAPALSDTSASDAAAPAARHAKRGHATLAGKVLQVFRVGGDSERSVGRHGKPTAVPEERRSGPVQTQVITDNSGPTLTRSIADSTHLPTSASALTEVVLPETEAPAAPASAPVSIEPIRLQTFSIDLTERLARTRAAQQEVLRELDKFDESGDDLGKSIDRKP